MRSLSVLLFLYFLFFPSPLLSNDAASSRFEEKIRRLFVKILEIEDGEMWESELLSSQTGGLVSFEDYATGAGEGMVKIFLTSSSSQEAESSVNSLKEFKVSSRVINGNSYVIEFSPQDIAASNEGNPCSIFSKKVGSEFLLSFEIKAKRGDKKAILALFFEEEKSEDKDLKEFFIKIVDLCLKYNNAHIAPTILEVQDL